MNNNLEKMYLDETNINFLITISSPALDDKTLSDYLDEEIREIISYSNDIYSSKLAYERFIVNTSEEFFSVLEDISNKTRKEGYYPGIHFDMHGGDKGLQIGATRELIAWDQLLPILREINKNVKNNLLVISSCCLSFEMIKSFCTFNEITPFNVLIAPNTQVTFRFLKHEFVNFFRELIKTEDIYTSYKEIEDEYGLYVSPHMFMSLLDPVTIQTIIDNSMLFICDSIEIKQKVVNQVVSLKATVFLAEKATEDLLDYLKVNIITALKL